MCAVLCVCVGVDYFRACEDTIYVSVVHNCGFASGIHSVHIPLTALLRLNHNVGVQFRTLLYILLMFIIMHLVSTHSGRITHCFCLKHSLLFLSQPLKVTAVPNHRLYYTSDFHHTPEQFRVTVNTGLGSPVQIDTARFCTRSTPSHTIISVADLEVKFNFPPRQQTPIAL